MQGKKRKGDALPVDQSDIFEAMYSASIASLEYVEFFKSRKPTPAAAE